MLASKQHLLVVKMSKLKFKVEKWKILNSDQGAEVTIFQAAGTKFSSLIFCNA